MYHIDLFLVFDITILMVEASFYDIILRNTVPLECMVSWGNSKERQNLADLLTNYS